MIAYQYKVFVVCCYEKQTFSPQARDGYNQILY